MITYKSSVSYSKKNKGNSLRTTIPIEIVKLLEIKEHDKILWIYDPKTQTVTIKKEG